ncbi:GTPase Obg [Trichinella spiralis]|uniref:GTPase Obg n=1 Tax=Trichinella spiralis TaxID=6334 RepID=A0ABR3K1I0_TRISP
MIIPYSQLYDMIKIRFQPKIKPELHCNLIIVIDEEDPIHWSSEPDPDRIGYRIRLERLRLPDLYHDLWTILICT